MKTQPILRAMTLLMMALALAVGVWGVMPTPVVLAYSCTSTGTGDWNAIATWTNCNGTIPQNGDDVTIQSGHTVTVNVNTATLNSLTVNGTLRFDNTGTGRSMMVTGNIVIGSSGRLDVATGGNATTHSLTIGGDLTNNGTFDGLPATGRIINVTFNRNGNQTITGTGTTRFNILTLNMGTSRDNILDVQAVISLNASANPLVIQNGTFRLSSASTITPFTTGVTIPATGGFWLNGGTVSTGNLSWTISGLLRISAGTLTIGTNAGNSVNYNTGSVITIEGGTLSIAGRLGRNNDANRQVTYTQSGGTVTVVRVESTSSNYAGFDIGNAGSSFTMSGGTIVIQRATSCTSGDYLNVASTYNVTGGTLQIGNASTPSANTMRINSTVPVGNLVVDGSTSEVTKPTAQLLNNSLTVVSDVTVQTGTTLNANDLNLTVGGNWANNGTFTAGSGTVTFNGSSAQTIGGSSFTAFNNLTINSGATVVIPTDNTPTVSTALTNNGALRQTRNVGTENTVFLNIGTAYYGVEIDPDSTAMGDTTVTVSGNQFCPNASAGVKRCFDITPASPQVATVRFYFSEAERNSQTLGNLKVWHRSGSAWVQETGTTSTGGSGNAQWVQVTGVSAYSPFLLSENNPTAITLASFKATSQDAPQGGAAILVTWETASELDNVGFNLYRSESAAGPYTLLNESLIPPQFPGEVMGSDYEWLDTDVQPGVTYYYKLEDIDVKGVSTFHGPVSTAVVTTPTAVQLQRIDAHSMTTPLVVGLIAMMGLWVVRRRR
ncbi:MAG: G8 domain-containing protein [Anaerolineae bacterium]|mgnify:CR=1 FL=1